MMSDDDQEAVARRNSGRVNHPSERHILSEETYDFDETEEPTERFVKMSQEEFDQMVRAFGKMSSDIAQLLNLVAQGIAMAVDPLREMFNYIKENQLDCQKHNGKNPCILFRGHEGKCAGENPPEESDE